MWSDQRTIHDMGIRWVSSEYDPKAKSLQKPNPYYRLPLEDALITATAAMNGTPIDKPDAWSMAGTRHLSHKFPDLLFFG
jgi:hypothetical protein